MNYYVYLLVSEPINKKTYSYVGYTNNLEKRIILHNSAKGAKFTRGRKWKLVYFEELSCKKKALKREYEVKKNTKLRNYLKKKFIKEIQFVE